MTSPPSTRRAFLARLGALGAALGAGELLPGCADPSVAEPETAEAQSELLGLLLGDLRTVLAEVARDTLNGVTTFVVPGKDMYSKVQGTPQPLPGAIEADATDFLMEALDNFVPFPDQLARPVAAALTTLLAGVGFKLPRTLGSILTGLVSTVDGALQKLLQNDQTIPLSVAMALLLNVVALQVNPLSLVGAFSSPFSRLSFADKAKVFKVLEGPDANLVALLDSNLPEPLRSSISGLLRFVSGALLELSTFGAYNEFGAYDKNTRTLTDRPVGWQLTGYLPDNKPVDGWNDFLGYYQGRTKAED